MKVAVLGAGGFVGSRAVEYFGLTGRADVRAVVRRYSGLARSARFAGDWRLADARREEELTAAFEGCEAVLHATLADNAEIVRCAGPVYRAAARAGVKRLVYLSSAAVHAGSGALVITEKTPPPRPSLTAYGEAKLAAETELLELGRAGPVGVAVLRPGIIVGPRSDWVANPARQLLAGAALLVEGGPGYCHTVYVDNLLDAVLAAVTSDRAAGEIFFVSDAETLTWSEYYHQLAAQIDAPASAIRAVPRPPLAPPPRWSDAPWIRRMRASPPYQAAAILTPKPGKALAHRLLGRRGTRPPEAGPAEPPASTPEPAIPSDLAELHLTPWRLSREKSRDVLGYRPAVSFAEAMRRSAGWLRFAGLV